MTKAGIGLALAIGFLCCGSAVPAGAGTAPDPGENPIVLVVDISGSMSDDDGNGKNKMDGAKLALLNFLQGVEPGTAIGLRTYPDQTSGASCNPGTPQFAIQPLQTAAMSAYVRALLPDGDTPTAEAMQAAADDLKQGGYTHGTLVIVSDGESTCGNPCDTAKRLAASGVELQTITIGFRISQPGEQELRCIAAATNGTYVDAGDSQGLANAIDKVTRPELEIALKYPDHVVAEAGSGPNGVVEVEATIANTTQQPARNVVARMRFDGASPGLSRPVVALGNLDAGASRTAYWRFRPGLLLAGSSIAFSVVARADNTLSDGVATGSVAVEDVTQASAAGPIFDNRRFLAIVGDSYSAGEGSDDYIRGTDTQENHCHRSLKTYLVGAFNQPESSVVACSGAVTADIRHPDDGNHVTSQLDQLSRLIESRGVDAVAMTLGGNDAHFAQFAKSCLTTSVACDKRVVTRYVPPETEDIGGFFDRQLSNDLQVRLAEAYLDVNRVLNSRDAVSKRGAVAPILVLAYVLPVPLTGRSCIALLGQLTRGEVITIGKFARTLNARVEGAVESARLAGAPVFYVPNTEDAFEPDHTICDTHPYARSGKSLNGAGLDLWGRVTRLSAWGQVSASVSLFQRSVQELAHPNQDGYEAETRAVLRWSLTPAGRHAADALPTFAAADRSAPSIKDSPIELGTLPAGSTVNVQPAATYSLFVEGLAPGANVEITLHSSPVTLGERQAGADGTLRTRIGIPAGVPPGRHTLVVAGLAGDGRHLRRIEIPVAVAAAGPPAPITIAAVVAGGSGLVSLVAAAVAGVIRRRRRLA